MTENAQAAIRRASPVVCIDKIKVGGGNPIVVQSMTNTDTADAKATASQVVNWHALVPNW